MAAKQGAQNMLKAKNDRIPDCESTDARASDMSSSSASPSPRSTIPRVATRFSLAMSPVMLADASSQLSPHPMGTKR